VGKEAVVIAAGAGRIYRQASHPCGRCLLRDERAQIDVAGPRNRLAGELFPYIGAHLVAPAADRRAQVDRQVGRGYAVALERVDGFRCDAGGRAAPPGVEQADDTGRVRDEYRNTVGDPDRERGTALAGDVSIGFSGAKPSIPATGVYEYPVTVNLPDRDEPARDSVKIGLQRGPPAHDLVDRVGAREAERSCRAGGGKRADAPVVKRGYRFLIYLTHRYARRSSTRDTEAPSAVRRSSIRS